MHTYVKRPHAHQRHRRRSPPQDVPELQPILRLRRQQKDLHLAHRHQILWLSLPYHLTQHHRNRHCRHAVFPCIRRLMVPLHLPHKLFIVASHHHLVKQSLTYFEERCQFRYHVRGSQGVSAPYNATKNNYAIVPPMYNYSRMIVMGHINLGTIRVFCDNFKAQTR